MSSYADHQRMVTLETRVATLEVRAAEAERMMVQLGYAMEALKAPQQQPLDQSGMHEPPSPASPYEQWRDKKAARKAAE